MRAAAGGGAPDCADAGDPLDPVCAFDCALACAGVFEHEQTMRMAISGIARNK
jgi:hypothetical protein